MPAAGLRSGRRITARLCGVEVVRVETATLPDLCDPQIELDSVFSELGGVYRGHDGMRRYFRDLEDAWGDETRREPEAFFDLGEHTLMLYVAHTRGRQSGVELAQPAAMAARWRDGLMVYVKSYAHKEDALSDLGVSEDALLPIDP